MTAASDFDSTLSEQSTICGSARTSFSFGSRASILQHTRVSEAQIPPVYQIAIRHPHDLTVKAQSYQEQEIPVSQRKWARYLERLYSGSKPTVLHSVHYPPGVDPATVCMDNAKIIAVRRWAYPAGHIPRRLYEPAGAGASFQTTVHTPFPETPDMPRRMRVFPDQ